MKPVKLTQCFLCQEPVRGNWYFSDEPLVGIKVTSKDTGKIGIHRTCALKLKREKIWSKEEALQYIMNLHILKIYRKLSI